MLKNISEFAGAVVSVYGAKVAFSATKRRLAEREEQLPKDEQLLTCMIGSVAALTLGLAITKAVSHMLFAEDNQ